MTFNKLDAAKKAVAIVIGACASRVVKSIIVYNTDEPDTTFGEIQQWTGSAAIGALVAAQVRDHTDHAIDEAIDGIAQIKKAIAEAKQEQVASTTKGP